MRGATRLLIALLVTLALLGAGCGNDDSGDTASADTASGDDGADTATETTNGGADADDGEVDPDGTFRFVTYSRPARLDPHRAPSAIDLVYLAIGYDRLVHLDPDASPVPGLATGWSFSEDGTTLSMTLREGVTFQDGTPFDAEAVKANIERGQSLPDSTVSGELEIIEEVVVVSENEVDLNLSAPSASLPLVLSDRAGMMISPAKFEANLDEEMHGSGMYELVDYRYEDVAVFERNEDYWDPDAAKAARLELYYRTDQATRLNGVRSGQFDAGSITPTELADAEAADLVVDSKPTMAFFQIYLNNTLEPLQDTRVRQAMQHAIDRDAIVKAIYQGRAQATTQPFPEGYFATDPDVGPDHFPYDPDQARALLEEAGYADGFEFEGLVPPSGEVQAEAIQAMLAEVGITMNPRAITGGEAAELFFNNEEGDALFAIWTGRPDPSMTTALLFTSDGFANPGGFSTPRVEELHKEALETFDPDKRQEALQELSAEIATEALNIIVAIPEEIQVATPEVIGLEVWASGKVEFRGVGMAAS